ncbi:hypothetical protein [Sulfurospirillum barnesii]|uniref:hypothetical protein n=1 Tax=Sulfurospirillum barnesii TaxID=44674 RepID=UPI0002E35A2D|nr:hypothetical protein [Sulfurospirillum barnesii]
MNVQTDETLQMRYDTETQTLVITTPKGLSIALNDATGSITLEHSPHTKLTLNDKGICLEGDSIEIHAIAELSLKTSGLMRLNGAMITLN